MLKLAGETLMECCERIHASEPPEELDDVQASAYRGLSALAGHFFNKGHQQAGISALRTLELMLEGK